MLVAKDAKCVQVICTAKIAKLGTIYIQAFVLLA